MLYAYRRMREVPKDLQADDLHTYPDATCIAMFDPRTCVFQLASKDGVVTRPIVDWRDRTAESFRSWVQQYSNIWSMEAKDAFWLSDYFVDEGL